jgi:hypothetical protein
LFKRISGARCAAVFVCLAVVTFSYPAAAAGTLLEKAEESLSNTVGWLAVQVDRLLTANMLTPQPIDEKEAECLAQAMYFEARDEPVAGQLAVARVIINRTNSASYPRSVCGVVYQNAGKRNACQFSFACDAKPETIKEPQAWSGIKARADWFLSCRPCTASSFGEEGLLSSTNYHADYVNPAWASKLLRTGQVGRHIFYLEEAMAQPRPADSVSRDLVASEDSADKPAEKMVRKAAASEKKEPEKPAAKAAQSASKIRIAATQQGKAAARTRRRPAAEHASQRSARAEAEKPTASASVEKASAPAKRFAGSPSSES